MMGQSTLEVALLSSTKQSLTELMPQKVYDKKLTADISKVSPPCLRAGLYLLNDDIQQAHNTAQAMDNETANYWHAILHRREGDFWNSKWWLSQISHPVLQRVWAEDGDMTEARSRAKAFVDKCQQASRKGGDAKSLKDQQWKELEALYTYCKSENV